MQYVVRYTVFIYVPCMSRNSQQVTAIRAEMPSLRHALNTPDSAQKKHFPPATSCRAVNTNTKKTLSTQPAQPSYTPKMCLPTTKTVVLQQLHALNNRQPTQGLKHPEMGAEEKNTCLYTIIALYHACETRRQARHDSLAYGLGEGIPNNLRLHPARP